MVKIRIPWQAQDFILIFGAFLGRIIHCDFSIRTEAGKDLKLTDFTPLAAGSSSPLDLLHSSINSFDTETAAVKELLFFVYSLLILFMHVRTSGRTGFHWFVASMFSV